MFEGLSTRHLLNQKMFALGWGVNRVSFEKCELQLVAVVFVVGVKAVVIRFQVGDDDS